MITCPVCEGKKTTPLTVVTYPSKGKAHEERVSIKCIDCDGAGTMTPEQHAKYLAFKKAMESFWCRCGNKSGNVSYHPDAPGSKHHWTCDDCGKTTQVG